MRIQVKARVGGRATRGLVTLAGLCWLAGCDSPVQPLIQPATSPAPFVVAVTSSVVTSEKTVFVSLPPGTFVNGISAAIRDVSTGSSVTATVVGGGFDPVSLSAVAADTMAVALQEVGASKPVSFLFTVPAHSPPIVIRTDPPAHKRDVPLNAKIVVVFSEPIDSATLTNASVQLWTGATVVSGQLAFNDAAHTSATFMPSVSLAGGTDYQLIVTQGIRDQDGDPLETPVTVPFTTAVVLPAAQLAFSVQPTTTGAGLTILPTIEVAAQDALGNLASSFSGTVSLSLGANPGGTSLTGTITATAVGGRAEFADLRISQIGTGYTLVATASGVSGATSTAFDITPPPRIAFASDRDGNWEIYLANADGSGVTRLTNDPAWDGQPAWSPDGAKLVFASAHSGYGEIYVMNSDGSGITMLTNDSASKGMPAWSPDGSRIAFSGVHSGADQIFVMNADGSGATMLTTGGLENLVPRWSPDGTQIAFERLVDAFTPPQIYLMNVDGTSLRLLNQSTQTHYAEHGPAWSPDGTTIAFYSYGYGLARVISDGSGPVVGIYSDSAGYAREPDWSPDGLRIAFTNYAGVPARSDIYIINADGGGLSRLFASPGTEQNTSPAWEPQPRP